MNMDEIKKIKISIADINDNLDTICSTVYEVWEVTQTLPLGSNVDSWLLGSQVAKSQSKVW